MARCRRVNGKYPNTIRFELFTEILKEEYLAGKEKKSYRDLYEIFPCVLGVTEKKYHQAARTVIRRMREQGLLQPTGFRTYRISDKILEAHP